MTTETLSANWQTWSPAEWAAWRDEVRDLARAQNAVILAHNSTLR